MQVTKQEKALMLAAYIAGYEQGHHDTVEAGYTDSEESGTDWINESLQDGVLEYEFNRIYYRIYYGKGRQ